MRIVNRRPTSRSTAGATRRRCSRVVRSALLALAGSSAVACSEGAVDPGILSPPPGDPVVLTEVTIQYFAPTAVDSAIIRDYNACFVAVNNTHLRASWRQWVRDNLKAVGPDEWTVTFADVPTDEWLDFIIHDPNGCPGNEFGASRDSIVANGVLLWRVGSIPGDEGEAVGMAFRVDSLGVVTP